MKKYVFLLSITLFAIIAIGNYEHEYQIEPVSQQIEVSRSSEILQADTNFFIARNLDGYIAIFVPDEILPCLVTDINVKTLPLADQQMLETGIIIDDEYGLAKFIEDYSS